MFDRKEPIRKTILIQLDVVISDESDEYLEVEMTHPRLAGALYLTVNDREEANKELDKVDLTGQELETEESEVKPKVETAKALGESPIFSTPKGNTHPVESLIRNSFKFASSLADLKARIKK